MIEKVASTKIFERSLKKLKKKHFDMSRLKQAITLIVNENQDELIRRFKWHMLKGDKAGINEIHLDNNWLLMYQITGKNKLTLLLLDTGSHDML